MQGFKLTFFTQQDRSVHGQSLALWLLKQAKEIGIQSLVFRLGAECAVPHHSTGYASCQFDRGYLIGLALTFFAGNPSLPPEWRLLVITGFLGGLTTFSTFSAEVTTLLQQGRLAWAGAAISVHVLGSLAMTLLGMASMNLLQRVP